MNFTLTISADRATLYHVNHLANAVHGLTRAVRHLDRTISNSQNTGGRAAGGFQYAISISEKERPAMPVEVSMSTEQRVQVTATPVTAAGKPAKVDGQVGFTCENPDVTIEQIDDTSAWINAPTAPGDVVVLVAADADLGAGVTTIQDTVLIHVGDPQAASLGLSVGTPEVKPA